jgi:Hint domain
LQLDRGWIDYFHVELPSHDVVLAEGLPVESYLDCGDRHTFANSGGVTMLFADFAGDNWEMSGYAPLVLRGPEVEAARAHLLARAAGLSRVGLPASRAVMAWYPIAEKRDSRSSHD